MLLKNLNYKVISVFSRLLSSINRAFKYLRGVSDCDHHKIFDDCQDDHIFIGGVYFKTCRWYTCTKCNNEKFEILRLETPPIRKNRNFERYKR